MENILFDQNTTAKIMIVDDQQNNIDSLIDVLEPLNISFITSKSPHQALDLLKENKGDIATILLDVQMPNMDGFELANMIQNLNLKNKPPIIFLTAIYKEPEYIHRGYHSGAVDYLTKPINIHVLRAKVTGFIEIYNQNKKNILLSQKLSTTVKKLKDLNENLNSFAYIVSHDLKAPLRQLTGFIDVFADIYSQKEAPPEEETLYLAKIQECAERMQRIINDILSFAKHGLSSISPEQIYLSNIIFHSEKQLRDVINASNAKISIEEDCYLEVDKEKFILVFQNLIQNAIKYCAKDTAPYISISYKSSKDTKLLKIKDNGIGIDTKHHKDIFTLLKRLHSEDEIPGSGIGLAVCEKIIEAHEGKIWVESTKGKGSTFIIELPQKGKPKCPTTAT